MRILLSLLAILSLAGSAQAGAPLPEPAQESLLVLVNAAEETCPSTPTCGALHGDPAYGAFAPCRETEPQANEPARVLWYATHWADLMLRQASTHHLQGTPLAGEGACGDLFDTARETATWEADAGPLVHENSVYAIDTAEALCSQQSGLYNACEAAHGRIRVGALDGCRSSEPVPRQNYVAYVFWVGVQAANATVALATTTLAPGTPLAGETVCHDHFPTARALRV